MSIYESCWNEREHRDDADRDARYGRKDHEYYDRYSDDPCKQAYTEEYDRETRRQEERRYEERMEERRQEEQAAQRRYEAEMEDARYYEEQQQEMPDEQIEHVDSSNVQVEDKP